MRYLVIGLLFVADISIYIDAQLAHFAAQDLAELAETTPPFVSDLSLFNARRELLRVHSLEVAGYQHRMRWISPLSRMKNLRVLSLEGTRVSDIHAVSRMKQLHTLDVHQA